MCSSDVDGRPVFSQFPRKIFLPHAQGIHPFGRTPGQDEEMVMNQTVVIGESTEWCIERRLMR